MGTARPTTGSASDQGRRRFNADALAVWAHGGGLGVAVADGIGDTAAAYGAAHVAADTAARAAAGGGALDALLAARAAIVGGKGDAVLVVAALRAGGGEIAWVGDCRAYFFDGAGVRQLTADQTMAAAVREAGAAAAPRWEHVVTASVRSASVGNAGRVRIPAGWGRLALVTDGVHRELSPAEIAAVLAHGHDPATAARELTDLALLAGGGDNASATVIEVPLVAALPAQRTDTSPAFPEVPGEAADTA
jgi:serine/threonine protein phosphatase PrpC